MKLQGLGIVFAIIILPVIIILSYYIQLSVDTVALQTSYKSKLNDSTYDSMLAFEMNTANENLSTVADSLRSIIEASNSVFFDSLASNFGMSNANKSLFQAYTPAILYTLYDGYYIYTPTKQPELLTYQDWMLEGLFSDNTSEDATIRFPEGAADDDKDMIEISKTDISSKGGQPIYTHDGRFVYKKKNGALPETADYQIGNSLYTAELSDESAGKISYKLEYMLKSYMPYTARYVHKDNTTGNTTHDITINYTLDNYMNIVGNINGIYYAKTGYLLPDDVVDEAKLEITNPDGTGAVDALGKPINASYLMALNEDEAEELCLSGKYRISLTINCRSKKNDGTFDQVTIVSNPQALDGDPNNIINSSGAREDEIQSQLSADYGNWHNNSYPLNPTGSNLLNRIQTEESELANMRAIAYYVRNSIFSKWVYDNLGDDPNGSDDNIGIKASDIQNDIISNTVSEYASSIGNNYSTKKASFDTLFQNFEGDNSCIFKRGQDPDLESNFANHKDGVIRNSIQYNLNLAFSSYTEMYGGNLSFQMPVISDTEWERIITNVSIVSFLQGIPCGTKNFSSYSIVNSTNNELTVIPSEIYYIPTNNFSDQGDGGVYAHRVDCESFPGGYFVTDRDTCSPYVSMKSNDVKYDGIYNKNKGIYEYNFRNLLDYSCIINKNLREKNYTIGGTEAEVQRLDPSKWVGDDALNSNRRIAYYTGIAEQRQRLYKTNALTTSSGYTYQKFADEYFSSNNPENTQNQIQHVKLAAGKTLKDVSEIEIYLKSFQVSVGNSIVIKISATSPTQQLELYGKDEGGNDIWVGQRGYSNLAEANGTNLTIRSRCHTTDSSTLNEFNILIEDVEANSFVYGKCIGVKITYK